MELTPGENEYVAFMQWFQTTHPELYAHCWNMVILPPDGERITFDYNAMEPALFTAMSGVVEQYYSKP